MFIFSTPVLIRHLCQFKTIVFWHWCLIHVVLLKHTLQSSITIVIYTLVTLARSINKDNKTFTVQVTVALIVNDDRNTFKVQPTGHMVLDKMPNWWKSTAPNWTPISLLNWCSKIKSLPCLIFNKNSNLKTHSKRHF